jgi:hypothetical protein
MEGPDWNRVTTTELSSKDDVLTGPGLHNAFHTYGSFAWDCGLCDRAQRGCNFRTNAQRVERNEILWMLSRDHRVPRWQSRTKSIEFEHSKRFCLSVGSLDRLYARAAFPVAAVLRHGAAMFSQRNVPGVVQALSSG